ncbi:MAG: 50S ribosomal protein L24 [Treponema sp.]|nr:50S ribosomal protein L24 [Spirochaetia bacterium]MDD6294863.1 50S ribosomal protein L24 [Treponema sp.]MDD7449735.1 50S ribosomal protein L24 [Treponema sp.]MDY2925222.1 50S ribosomal protein L24 [Treponema sp.]MDY5682905.1 50S ribosomal protein L24 [Treponema sp.]
MVKKYKIHKDDTVQVLAGKDKGAKGTVVRIIPKKDAVIVSGVNIVKKAMKKRSQQDQGGISEIEAPLNISNVAIVCKKCGPTKIGYKLDGNKKIRVCRKCGETL